jgi:hypothetical protein
VTAALRVSRKPRIALAAVAAVALAALCLLAGETPGTTSGYLAKINNTTNSDATAQYFSCTSAEAADQANAYFQYYLDQASAATAAPDSSNAANTGTYQGSMTTSTATPIACSRDADGAYVLNGTTSFVSTLKQYVNPTTFSEEVWFKTTVAAGKLIGFGNAQLGSSSKYDRHLYIETTGKLDFGTYNGGLQLVTTPGTVTDGKWHHAVGTMSPATGMKLYLDGALVASNASYVTPENTTGYWRVGYDNTSGWRNNGSVYFFSGQMRYAAVYSVVLTATQIGDHWAAGQ